MGNPKGLEPWLPVKPVCHGALTSDGRDLHSVFPGSRGGMVRSCHNSGRRGCTNTEEILPDMETVGRSLCQTSLRVRLLMIPKLSEELKEKDERWLSCQLRCESLREKLLAWQQREKQQVAMCTVVQAQRLKLETFIHINTPSTCSLAAAKYRQQPPTLPSPPPPRPDQGPDQVIKTPAY
ncbi:unnamed protein product [Boreogadus saida]